MTAAVQRRTPAGNRQRHWLLSLPALALLAAGLLLRVYFLRRHAFLAGDSYLYQEIAQNWLHEHVYGLSTDAAPRPTLIRVPGYPAILAALAWLFDRFLQAGPGTLRCFLPVLWLQIVTDLLTCMVAATVAWRMAGARAGRLTLLLACACPFTANYTAVPLTETFTLFFLVLAYWVLQRWLLRPSRGLLTGLAAALSCSILLRPDQGLLAVAVLPVLLLRGKRQGWRAMCVCAALAALPFVPWTVRNWHTFHVVQPLASRLAIDPGEITPTGFQAWFRTWAVDFSATEDAYWKYPEEAVLITDLPARTFDSPKEYSVVIALLQRASLAHGLDSAVEQGFQQLSRQRAQAHPVRTYLLLPVARLINMWLHPRTEMLPVAERWWQYRQHPRQTLFAWAYGALNIGYLLAGFAGLVRLLRQGTDNAITRALLLSMLAYIALRSLLLLTLDNAEQRYTLEFLPLLMVGAAGLVLPWKRNA